MSIHPIEYRYGSKEIRNIFSRKTRLKYFLKVELAILKALEEAKLIPNGIYDEANRIVNKISLKRIDVIEGQVRHETMAVILAINELSGKIGKYIHLGATSNDILDSILAMQLRDALRIIRERLKSLIIELIKLCWRERRTVCIGRTHGRAAIPTTFGYRILMYVDELDRVLDLLNFAAVNACVGKYSGAVGIYAELGEIMNNLERRVMELLKISPARYSTQIVPRDRLATLITTIGLISSILDQFGREIRNLQRSGIEEVYEPFLGEQIGSSVMPHKRNPIMSEKICGLSKVVRGIVIGALENIVLEHERDLTNSSFERIVIPELFLILDEQIITMLTLIKGIQINRDQMLKNIRKEEPWIYSDLIVQIAVLRGADRQKIYGKLRKLAMIKENDLLAILNDEYIQKYITTDDINKITDIEYYRRLAENRVKSILPEIARKYNLTLPD